MYVCRHRPRTHGQSWHPTRRIAGSTCTLDHRVVLSFVYVRRRIRSFHPSSNSAHHEIPHFHAQYATCSVSEGRPIRPGVERAGTASRRTAFRPNRQSRSSQIDESTKKTYTVLSFRSTHLVLFVARMVSFRAPRVRPSLRARATKHDAFVIRFWFSHSCFGRSERIEKRWFLRNEKKKKDPSTPIPRSVSDSKGEIVG